MYYNDFLTELMSQLKNQAPELSFDLMTIHKNNINNMEAITVRYDNSDLASPVFYPWEYYNDYMSGCSIRKIASEIIDVAKKERNLSPSSILSQINSETAKKNLVLHLVNKKTNTEMISKSVGMDYLDLVALPYLRVTLNDMDGSIPVTREMITHLLKMTPEEVLQTAYQNTMRQDFWIQGMTEKLLNMVEMDEEEFTRDLFMVDEKEPMYVASNTSYHQGSVAMMSNSFMQKIQLRIGEETFFILPSSIHEIMIVPESINNDVLAMRDMIQQVNSHEVDPQEQLSDSLYYYNGKKLQICNTPKQLAEQKQEARESKIITAHNTRGGIKR